MYEEQDASAYNRNTDTQAIENVKCRYDYWRERPGTGTRVTGTRVSSGGVNIIFPTAIRTTAAPKITAAAGKSMPCAFPRMAIMRTR